MIITCLTDWQLLLSRLKIFEIVFRLLFHWKHLAWICPAGLSGIIKPSSSSATDHGVSKCRYVVILHCRTTYNNYMFECFESELKHNAIYPSPCAWFKSLFSTIQVHHYRVVINVTDYCLLCLVFCWYCCSAPANGLIVLLMPPPPSPCTHHHQPCGKLWN